MHQSLNLFSLSNQTLWESFELKIAHYRSSKEFLTAFHYKNFPQYRRFNELINLQQSWFRAKSEIFWFMFKSTSYRKHNSANVFLLHCFYADFWCCSMLHELRGFYEKRKIRSMSIKWNINWELCYSKQ